MAKWSARNVIIWLWGLWGAVVLPAYVAYPQSLPKSDHVGHELKGALHSGGRDRTFIVHLPRRYRPGHPVPLVIVLHGGGGSSAKMIRLTGGKFNALADRDNVLIVYPDAYKKNWNDGRGLASYPAMRQKVDDVGFIAALIEYLSQRFSVDQARVYVVGVSNGAMMSMRLACELSEQIAAVAPIIGALPSNLQSFCAPKRAVPMILFNGTDDPLVPWEGGDVRFGRKRLGQIISVPDTVEFWAAKNGCLGSPVVTDEEDRDPADATRVRKETYSGCRDNAEVVFYAVQGGGHTCPGGSQYLPPRIIGRVSRDVDAIDRIWEFFQRYRLAR